MFCSDDKHPDDLIIGHVNQLVSRALRKGCELFDVLTAACLNPVAHYKLPVGTLRVGDPADFIVTDDLEDFSIKQTYINGILVSENKESKIPSINSGIINNFQTDKKTPDTFSILIENYSNEKIRVIKALDGQLITDSFLATPKIADQKIIADPENDILKFTVVNRYKNTAPAVAFIQNFNLKNGAIASCVGHDSHNILAVGTDDNLLCEAVNLIIENKGGISAVSGNGKAHVLPLPVAGIMTTEDGYVVAEKYGIIDKFVKETLGSKLSAPFMTLSFMALLVIPALKLSDLGLFDGKEFNFVDLIER